MSIGDTIPVSSAQKYEKYQTTMINGTITTLRRNNTAQRMANGKGKRNEPSGKWSKEMTADPAPHSAKRMKVLLHLSANLAAFLAVLPIQSLAELFNREYSRKAIPGESWPIRKLPLSNVRVG
jgi:hypothetical protein